jgi:hypothetical protein
MPVGAVAGEARDFEPQDDPDLAERNLADELLEAVTPGGIRARLSEVAVDDVDALGWPAEGDGAIA